MTNLPSHPSCLLQIDPETGKHFTNLFDFIPMENWMLDTLHLLLRCVDRLVHTMVLLFLRLEVPMESDLIKQVNVVNKILAPYVGRLMRKRHTSFQPPDEHGSLWKISHVNSTGYRLLLKEFKYDAVLPGKGQSTLRYQEAWRFQGYLQNDQPA